MGRLFYFRRYFTMHFDESTASCALKCSSTKLMKVVSFNAAIEGFVRAAAIELPRGLCINASNPTLLQESITNYGPYFLGFETVSASRVAMAYARSVDGLQTGRVYRVW